MSKVILVTGTSTGLGVSIAVQAARQGHTVYATMRNLNKRQQLDAAVGAAGVSVNVLQLDVQSSESIQSAVNTVLDQQGQIDTLVNNAGAGFIRSTEQASEEDVQWVMDVNYLGVVRCCKAVLPHMRQRGAGHIIAVTSVGGLVGQPFNEFYCAAKFAVEGYMEAMASYITPSFGVQFTAIEPGGITTEFANNVLSQVEQSGGMLNDDYLPILQQYIGGSQNRQSGSDIYQSADQVADVVVDVINAENPPIRSRTSKWGEELTHFKTAADPDGKLQQADVIKRFLS